ncbi:phosphonoacetaldehyde reductase [Desulfonatronum parangueonense]
MPDASGNVATRAWSYRLPTHINAGPGIWADFPLPDTGAGQTLLVTTKGSLQRGFAARLVQSIPPEKLIIWDRIQPNPDLGDLDQAIEMMRHAPVAMIVALGGGSVLDAAKVFSIALVEEAGVSLRDCLVHGRDYCWKRKLPLIAVPTTSGTGAEVTPFATVWDGASKKKYSLAHEHLFPDYAVLDPELTLSLPYRETMYTGLDLVSHALESLWNQNASPVSQAFAWQALALANESFVAVLDNPRSIAHRANMQSASMLAGMAISQTRTAIAHAISYPLTAYFGIPHGLACGFALHQLIQANKNMLLEPGEAWRADILEGISHVLLGLNLTEEVHRYASLRAVMDVIGEMFNPERAGNYFRNVEQSDIEQLVIRALYHERATE